MILKRNPLTGELIEDLCREDFEVGGLSESP